MVVSVMEDHVPPLLRVAYGTSQKPRPIPRGCFLMEDADHLKVAGLWKATRFDLKNVVVLPWTSGAFINAPGKNGLLLPSPIMGAMHAGCYPEFMRAAIEAGLRGKQ